MIKTRFAPSPTGYLHIGGVRTALFSWAFSKKYCGEFVIRIEDTDIERSTESATQAIYQGLQWLNIQSDHPIIKQTERLTRYQDVVQKMLADGLAYYCYMSNEELDALRAMQKEKGLKPKYDNRWRPENITHDMKINIDIQPVIRFKNPTSGTVSWVDLVKKKITFDNAELDDFIIVRSNGIPTYNFCVAIDDYDMQITHVIRGDDHVNNTPKQINLLKALNASVPQYAHLPMILGEDNQKLSKRHGAVSVIEYKEMGILPEALLNHLSRLGWSHQNEEIFSMEQFIEWFDLNDVNPAAAQFDVNKLLWINNQYIKKTPISKIIPWFEQYAPTSLLKNGIKLANAIDLYKERSHTLQELLTHMMQLFNHTTCSAEQLNKYLNTNLQYDALTELLEQLKTCTWNHDSIHKVIKDLCKKYSLKMHQLGMPIRIMITGLTDTPSFIHLIETLGYDEICTRIKPWLHERINK